MQTAGKQTENHRMRLLPLPLSDFPRKATDVATRAHRTTSLRRPRSRGAHAGGFSLIELLVAIIIIGVLVTVLLPVISGRTEQARVSRVQSDLENLSEAMERAAIDTGYYVRLFALNSVLEGDGVPFNRGLPGDPINRADGLTDYLIAQPWLQFPTANSLFIDPNTGDFATGVSRLNIINRLLQAEESFDGSMRWGGPYINWQRDSSLYNEELGKTGIPDDPWGNDYLFFTRQGLLLEPNGIFVESAGERTGGGFDPGGQFDALVFDRPTIVSLGPNGRPGDGTGVGRDGTFGGGDDYVRSFGR